MNTLNKQSIVDAVGMKIVLKNNFYDHYVMFYLLNGK